MEVGWISLDRVALGGGLDEGLEKAAHGGDVGEALGVPLDGQGKGMTGDFHGLHQAIGGMGHGSQRRRHPADSLVVQAVDVDQRLADGPGQA